LRLRPCGDGNKIIRDALPELGRCRDVESLVSTTGKKHENSTQPVL
jgi:hypothetical protein